MRRRFALGLRAKLALVALVLLALPALAKPPRLTLFISVDGLGSDVVQRHRPAFKYGLKKLVNDGAFFPTMHYEAAKCVTAVGHATLATGANPWRHGVVGNKVIDRGAGKLVPVFEDPGHPALEAPQNGGDVSPKNLLAETLSDRLRAATWRQGKAIAITSKPRAAIAMAGRLGEAYWFNDSVGRFVTGTWYLKAFPDWMRAFNDKKGADAFHDKSWDLLLPAKNYRGADEAEYESDWYAMGRTFPHPLNGGLPAPGPQSWNALSASPMMNELLVDAAKAAIAGEKLGGDDVPDLLSVGFSAFDKTYHLYGPDSWELQDHMLRLDKALGELLSAAERAAGGKGNLLVVLTADHGGAAAPEYWAAQGFDAARVPPDPLLKGLNAELEAKFKVAGLAVAMEETDVYLERKAMQLKRLDATAVRRAAAAWLRAQPPILLAVAQEDLEGPDTGGYLRSLQLGYHPAVSGDVLFTMKPFQVLESEPRGTNHGTPHTYDSEVPLFLYGHGVRSGIYPGPIVAVDVAPTVAAVMELRTPASCEGKARAEALVLPR